MTWARRFAAVFAHAGVAVVAGFFAIELMVSATPAPDLSRFEQRSQLVTASNGEPLWGFLTADQRWRLSMPVQDADPKFLRMLTAYEDKRFQHHRGVDYLALVRAALDGVRNRKAVSGGSTLTMQVVRLLEPQPRTLQAKVEQILKALKLERLRTKAQILEIYLTLAPYGGNIEGLRAASLMYFGKEPGRLSVGEAALLTALPQSPENLRPDRKAEAARAAKDRILRVLSARGAVEASAAARGIAEPIPASLRPLTVSAPHLAQRTRERALVGQELIRTTIDRRLQDSAEALATRALGRWDAAVSIAVVVIRNKDTAITAYVSGAGLNSRERSGHVDLVQAVRSPGSALKPFVYAQAFEQLIVHPETIITDHALDIAGYRPENADGHFVGDLSARQMLIRSRNTPAVMLLEKVGVGAFMSRFREAGRALSLPTSDRPPGLAVALGGVGVSLEQITWFYSALAGEGKLGALRLLWSDPIGQPARFLDTYAARATADILADVPPPAGYARQLAADGGRRIGFKTGTSYGFRDAWAVGFDALHTVGVWVGRPDGAAHLGAYGVTAAAPLLMQIFDALPTPPKDVRPSHADLGPLTTQRALPRRLVRLDAPPAGAVRPLEVIYPRNGATVYADRRPGAPIEIGLTAAGGKPPYRWTLAGALQLPSEIAVQNWSVPGRGQFDVRVIDDNGAVAESSFWIE